MKQCNIPAFDMLRNNLFQGDRLASRPARPHQIAFKRGRLRLVGAQCEKVKSKRSLMSSILRIKNADWRRHEDSQEKSCGQPISLMAFLQTENIKLQNSASQLEVEITALRRPSGFCIPNKTAQHRTLRRRNFAETRWPTSAGLRPCRYRLWRKLRPSHPPVRRKPRWRR
jgi:hypothetical protein